MNKWNLLKKTRNKTLLAATILLSAQYCYADECHMGIRGSEGGSSNLIMTSYSNTIRWARSYGPKSSMYKRPIGTAEMDLDPWLESQCDAGNDGQYLTAKMNTAYAYSNISPTDYTTVYKTNIPGVYFSVKIFSDAGGGYFAMNQQDWAIIEPDHGDDRWKGKRWKAHIDIYQDDYTFEGNKNGETYLTPAASFTLGQMGIGDPSDSDNKPWTFTVTPSSFQIPIITSTCQTMQLDHGGTNIDLGEYMMSDFNSSPRSNDFMIQLLGCNNVWAVDFKMNASKVTGPNDDLLGNILTSNAAEGIGVRLRSIYRDEYIKPGIQTTFYNIDTSSGAGVGMLTFDAQLVKDGNPMKAGDFKAQATFTTTYY
ncbi:hypothetical protein L370_02111 [Enterobacter sp. MGH 24]|uniref:fimbrial protein n=1 Tax=Enterobacter sp. MGH 24 TaxID=1329828 RepID=UPI0003BE7D9E|nr:fimbrial protein [Enterobacter sp. MGH 24]ESN16047.1 hypothetical protein L370_02111 [Enterobacter sp. MGH 24]